jgi:hypothetical protein
MAGVGVAASGFRVDPVIKFEASLLYGVSKAVSLDVGHAIK